MTGKPELLRQGTQRRGGSCSIGFIAAKLRPSDAGGGLVARLGVAWVDGRTIVELGPGEGVSLPGGGELRVVDIFVNPDGTQAAAAIEVSEPSA